MPAPVIGSHVHYWPGNPAEGMSMLDREQPCVATVVFVHPNGEVNLAVLDHHGNIVPRHNIAFNTAAPTEGSGASDIGGS